MSAPEIRTLNNGIRIAIDAIPGAQSIAVGFRFVFGAKDDPDDCLGITRIAEDALFKGTPSRDAHAILNTFDALGIRRSATTAVEHLSFQAQLLPRNFRAALDLYADLFRRASFPDDQVDIAKTLALEDLKRLEDNPIQQVLYKTYEAALGSPMGRIPIGESETLAAITPPGVRHHWKTHANPGNLLIAVAGGLTVQEIFSAVENAFADWEGIPVKPGTHPALTIADRRVHHKKTSEQAHIGMLFGGAPRSHTYYYAAQVAIAILSGSGSSRLFTEVREKRGLAYSVTAFYRPRRGGGLVALYAGTTDERAQETLDVCRREIARLSQDVTAEELNRAKTVLKGRLFTTGDLPEGRAAGALEDLFLEGRARSIAEIAAGIDAVSLDHISACLDAFPPSPCTIAVLGPHPLKS